MTTSYFLTAVSHHGSSDCLLYERYPIRRYLCRSAKITRRNSRLHHLQMETPDTDLHPARNDFLYDASASLLTILLFAKKERSHKTPIKIRDCRFSFPAMLQSTHSSPQMQTHNAGSFPAARQGPPVLRHIFYPRSVLKPPAPHLPVSPFLPGCRL